jgi:hypothetical protein
VKSTVKSASSQNNTNTPRFGGIGLDTIIAQAGGIGLGLCPGRGANHGDTTVRGLYKCNAADR